MTALRFFKFTFSTYYVWQLLCFETITFCDATLSDINVILCYVLSQYPLNEFNSNNGFYDIFTLCLMASSPEAQFIVTDWGDKVDDAWHKVVEPARQVT